VTSPGRRGLYPEIEPYRTHLLPVSGLHTLYVEESGNPAGKPVVFVHGGPGHGSTPTQRRFFDPDAYRIVLFDQRGCGRSTPHASLTDNTTAAQRVSQHNGARMRVDDRSDSGGEVVEGVPGQRSGPAVTGQIRRQPAPEPPPSEQAPPPIPNVAGRAEAV
jgi:pimeloyl-ACP methyl ester carboxylesterase